MACTSFTGYLLTNNDIVGTNKRRGIGNPLTLEERLRIYEMREAGIDKQIIAAEFRVTIQTVNRVLRNHDSKDDTTFKWEAAKKIDPVTFGVTSH